MDTVISVDRMGFVVGSVHGLCFSAQLIERFGGADQNGVLRL